jgi:hypothetical protein
MNRVWVSFCIAFFAGLLFACSADPTSNPATIEYGKDNCSRCGNVIQDARFAAQYSLSDGTVKKFDDPGCLIRSLTAEATAPSTVRLHVYAGDTWLDASEAWLARTPRIVSPRGYGWAAYPTFGAAQEAVTDAGDGELLRFEDAREKIAQAPAR